MIERLVIHRFRGIREGELDDIRKVNLLIGPNGSGKTAVLELLYLAGLAGRPCNLIMRDVEPSVWPAQTLVATDQLGEEPMPRLREQHGEPDKCLASPVELAPEETLDIVLDTIPEDHPLHHFELAACLQEANHPVFFRQDSNRISMFRLEPWQCEVDYQVPAPLIPDLFENRNVRIEESRWMYLWEAPFVYAWDRQEPLDHLAVWALFGALPTAEHTVLFDFHTANKPFSANFVQKAYREIPGWEEKITRHLVEVFPALQGAKASIRPVKQKDWTGFIELPGKTPLSIDHFGDGARHALKVLAVLTAMAERVDENHPGLFLWEDPELFMHPASLQRLLRQVMQLVEGKPIQVFLSSQSLETVALLTHYFHKKAINWSEELRAFRLNLEGGHLYAATFHFENLVTWLEQGMDPRFWEESDAWMRR